MNINKLIYELQVLADKGYGETEATIYEKGLFDKPYLTTVENIKFIERSKDFNNEDAIVLLR